MINTLKNPKHILDNMIDFGWNNIAQLRPNSVKRRRISSHSKDHGNMDFLNIRKLESIEFATISGAGCVKHFWVTIDNSDKEYLRKIVLQIYWDGEDHPSVEVPIGDFFGIGHGVSKDYWSLPLCMSPQQGKGFNCWWPMPFSNGAKFILKNETKRSMFFYFYIDYEEYEELPANLGRFHACWNRVNPCQGISEEGIPNDKFQLTGINEDFSQNYVIMEAQGKGHYCGCHLDIHNLRETDEHNWPGEGDDMIFIDGSDEPEIYGTGTEDFFGTAWCPEKEFCTPFYGITMAGGKNWSGKISYYRYHIADPIYFDKSIKVTIEHGHANRRSDDYSSTAYWYQTEPHAPFALIPEVKARVPRKEPKEIPTEIK